MKVFLLERREELKEKNSKKRAKKGNKSNREFVIVAYCFIAIFVAMIGNLIYFQTFQAEDIINNTHNKRQKIFANTIIRGDILSSDGEVLATTKLDKNGDSIRVYPKKNEYAHAIGYSTNGTTGVEELANFSLLRSHSFIGDQIQNLLSNSKNQGDSVVTTLDSKLQDVAYQALGSYEGAVIAIEPDTGKILCMVSKPDYDPNEVAKNYESLIGVDQNNKEKTVLLNRATQGSYTPGSTFKILTTLEYMNETGGDALSYNCTGSKTEEGVTIHCSSGAVHGKVDLEKAFAYSCNCAYATMGLGLDMTKFAKMNSRLLFNSELPIDYPYTKSKFSLNDNSSKSSIMMGSFGQEKITVSPIHMAMIVSTIANDGILMKPYVIDHVENDGQTLVKQYKPEEYKRLLSSKISRKMQKFMRSCVKSGTAKALLSNNYKAAGKTGSAQVSDTSNATHSWFVGYAKGKTGKSIAIAVIVEKQGSGSKFAVPISKKVFDAYFDK